MQLLESINLFLPKIKLISPKNEVDYYGFSYYLNNYLGYKNYNYSFSSWVHGWIYSEHKFIEKFNTSQYYPHLKIVADKSQENFLKSHGFKKVISAGYPYIYINKNKSIKRYKNSLLVMPPKNSRDTLTKWNEDEFINRIKLIKNDFENIFFCIDQVSAHNKMWIDKIKENNFQYIIGADSRDAMSLLRMKIIFQHFEYVHSPVIGSAIAYAAFEGCKVSISNDYLEYDLSGYKRHPLYEKKREFLDYEIYTKSKNYIKNKFTFLFQEPLKSVTSVDWAKNQLGYKFKQDFQKIPYLLGWRVRDKIRYFPLKYFKSLSNKIKK